MIILATDGDHPDHGLVEQAAAVLRSGQLIIFPTDTLYAIGGLALGVSAARLVRLAKGREDKKPLPVVAADVPQVHALCATWPRSAETLSQFWPGPLTLVLAAREHVPAALTAGSGTLAVRVPGLLLTRALCHEAGPLISTSANRAGTPAAQTCADALLAVGAAASLAVDAGPGKGIASTIVDLTGSRPRLLRQGALSLDAIEAALGTPLDRPGPPHL